MANYQIHQAYQLRHKKNERKNSQSQEGMGEHLAANVPVN
jgi:hypothetical protein